MINMATAAWCDHDCASKRFAFPQNVVEVKQFKHVFKVGERSHVTEHKTNINKAYFCVSGERKLKHEEKYGN